MEHPMVKITVPATSANLGSGFDSMGVALTLYNTVCMEEADHVHITSLGQAKIQTDSSNLIYRTVKKVYQLCGKKLSGLRMVEDSEIPKTRGLGSSSACVAAGILGANAMLNNPMGLEDIIDLAAKEEGHPDNSTPALVGGMVVAVLERGHVQYVKIPVAKKLCFAALIPEFLLETSRARAALPEQISHQDARFNLSRSALLAASLATGQLHNLKIAMDDRLHQPYRYGLIPRGKELVDQLYNEGALGACISGAGPTILAVGLGEDTSFQKKIQTVIQEYPGWSVLFLGCDEVGARVR